LRMTDNEFARMLRRLLEETAFEGFSLTQTLTELERRYGENVYPDALFHLTRMAFPNDAARQHITNILRRHQEMSTALGRPVGLRTAVCDYFLSQEKLFKEPVVVETRLLVQSEESALVDELTGLHNRRFLNTQLSKELDRSRRNKDPFSLLLIDVDHFKSYNDTHGHLAGDAALRQVAALIRKTARHMDHVARYGGEEFVVMLPQTAKEEAMRVAERHRMAVAGHLFDHGLLTVSIGVSNYPDDADHEADLLFRADFALYEAKKSGRNMVRDNFDDKRRSVRYDLNLPVECRRADTPENGCKGRLINLSQGGMLCEVGSHLAPGLRLEALIMDRENKQTLPISAISKRAEQSPQGGPFRVALEFDHETGAKKDLRCLINEKLGFHV